MKRLRENVLSVVQVEQYSKALGIIRAELLDYTDVKIVTSGSKTQPLWNRKEIIHYLRLYL